MCWFLFSVQRGSGLYFKAQTSIIWRECLQLHTTNDWLCHTSNANWKVCFVSNLYWESTL